MGSVPLTCTAACSECGRRHVGRYKRGISQGCTITVLHKYYETVRTRTFGFMSTFCINRSILSCRWPRRIQAGEAASRHRGGVRVRHHRVPRAVGHHVGHHARRFSTVQIAEFVDDVAFDAQGEQEVVLVRRLRVCRSPCTRACRRAATGTGSPEDGEIRIIEEVARVRKLGIGVVRQARPSR